LILNFTGDVVLADLFESYSSGIGSRLLKGSFNPFMHFQEYFSQGDINVINLESVLASFSSKKHPRSEIMRGTSTSIDLLKASGIHAVNLANNHSFDHGIEAFNEMVSLLDDAGILHFGGPRDVFQEYPSTLKCEGINISFLGYYIEESMSTQKRDSMIEQIIRNVERFKKEKEILVLSLHWGSEYTNKPLSWMIKSGKRFIDSGVDILYGHHSHTYQGVAMYKNGVYAPSLGNFIFEDRIKKNRRSAMLQVEYKQTGMKYRTIPLFINKEGVPSPLSLVINDVDYLNSKLEFVMGKKSQDLTSWDENAAKQIYIGHIKNRLKIRFKVLTNPIKYFPFILNK
jgi:hypothetical protein